VPGNAPPRPGAASHGWTGPGRSRRLRSRGEIALLDVTIPVSGPVGRMPMVTRGSPCMASPAAARRILRNASSSPIRWSEGRTSITSSGMRLRIWSAARPMQERCFDRRVLSGCFPGDLRELADHFGRVASARDDQGAVGGDDRLILSTVSRRIVRSPRMSSRCLGILSRLLGQNRVPFPRP